MKPSRGQIGSALPLLAGLAVILLFFFTVAMPILNNAVADGSVGSDEITVFFLGLAAIIPFAALLYTAFARMLGLGVGS